MRMPTRTSQVQENQESRQREPLLPPADCWFLFLVPICHIEELA